MTESNTPVTQADALLAEKFWRVHPDEIIATGMTREEWYAHHIARHRLASVSEAVAREAAMREALADLVEALLAGRSIVTPALFLDHPALLKARALLANPASEGTTDA